MSITTMTKRIFVSSWKKYDLMPRCGASLAAATVRGLILTVSHKEQIGELYPQVLETLVYGACRELFE